MTDLLVIVPTRGRPERFAEFLKAWEDTTDGTAWLLACVDNDDQSRYRYPILDGSYGCYSVSPPFGFAPRLDTEAVRHSRGVPDPFAIASLNDDHLPRTPGWDGRMVEALRDLGSGIVYGNDLLQYEDLPTAPAITSDIIRALGFMCPPGLRHVYIDNFWRSLGIRLERLRYLPDVVIEHCHWGVLDEHGERKAAWDATYEAGSTNEIQVSDLATWSAYRASEQFTADVERVRKAIA